MAWYSLMGLSLSDEQVERGVLDEHGPTIIAAFSLGLYYEVGELPDRTQVFRLRIVNRRTHDLCGVGARRHKQETQRCGSVQHRCRAI